jgi:hypothetical protein
MHIKQALVAYRNQKSGAKRRGIEFCLSFKEWCDWWGEDIGQRGNGPDQLQMQRLADSGPYALGNIRKGCPRDNMKTAGHMKRLRAAKMAEADLSARKDAMMFEPSNVPMPETTEDEEFFKTLGYRGGARRWMVFNEA